MKWVKPKDQFVELSAYTLQKGDPQTNGLGHIIVPAPDGTQLVKIGNTGIWEKEESLIFQSAKQQVLDDGSDELTQMFAAPRFKDVVAAMVAGVGGGQPSGSAGSSLPAMPSAASTSGGLPLPAPAQRVEGNDAAQQFANLLSAAGDGGGALGVKAEQGNLVKSEPKATKPKPKARGKVASATSAPTGCE